MEQYRQYPSDDDRMTLSAAAVQEAQEAHSRAAAEFLDPGHMLPNVVGLGVGNKIVNGQPTGEPALMVLVTHKEPPEYLPESDQVPGELGGVQTDTFAVGELLALGNAPVDSNVPMDSATQTPR
jgi:hypothetical protein